MSIAQQISKLVSLTARGLLDDNELAFAIRELRTAAMHEEKMVAPPTAVSSKADARANLKRGRKAAKAIMAAVHAEPAKKGPKRPRTAQGAADDWERFLDETRGGKTLQH